AKSGFATWDDRLMLISRSDVMVRNSFLAIVGMDVADGLKMPRGRRGCVPVSPLVLMIFEKYTVLLLLSGVGIPPS
ncbi:MAG: hypothetical protein K2G30_02620, partial [Muribaculaceae bacterium]|nr:hypothetical protein [Muribaculaceae bacterium]